MLCLCHYGPALLRFFLTSDAKIQPAFWKYRRGISFLTMVTRWSCSTSNFYALIGQNLTGEFMRKIYAASWKVFTLTAEADKVLCQLVMFLTVFFLWMCRMNTAAIKSLLLFMAGLVIGFLFKKCVACQNSVIRFRMRQVQKSDRINSDRQSG